MFNKSAKILNKKEIKNRLFFENEGFTGYILLIHKIFLVNECYKKN